MVSVDFTNRLTCLLCLYCAHLLAVRICCMCFRTVVLYLCLYDSVTRIVIYSSLSLARFHVDPRQNHGQSYQNFDQTAAQLKKTMLSLCITWLNGVEVNDQSPSIAIHSAWKKLCYLWPPCVADVDIIFVLFLSFSFFLGVFSSPNLNCRRLDVYHTCTHSVALVRI